MRYVVFGAGAVGGVIGGRLHAAGRDVALVARGDHLRALQADGLHLLTPDGEEHHAIPAVGSIGELDLTADDVVLLTMKSQDTVAALNELVAVAPPDIAVVCAQNGIANEPEALRRFRHVYGLCVILPSQFTAPGVVVQQSAPSAGVLDLGCYPTGADDRAEAIAADLEAASFRAAAEPAIMRNKRRKLLMNLGNALDALCGWEARSSDLYTQAQAEGIAAFAAAGLDVQTAEEEAARRDGGVSLKPVAGQERGGSSSWQSLARGTGSIETDYLNGEVVLLGRCHGVPTPVNEALQRMANEAARTGRPAGSVPLDDVQALLN
ncbi:MAG: putative ketopantoate reductase PanE/ApbA family protein [Actinomycetia bacterium]|nr:putative ketopantoate reductase PanE/ApbA family protein [Actinomycetes bacterium]